MGAISNLTTTYMFAGFVVFALLFVFTIKVVVWTMSRAAANQKEENKKLQVENGSLQTKCHRLQVKIDSQIAEIETLVVKNQELQALASTDSLTGLLTRRAFEPNLLAFTGQLPRGGDKRNGEGEHSLGVMLIDIDHFKKVNDTFGHDVGDEVLKVVAAAISASLRKTDSVCRWGGEEIAVSLPNATKEVALVLAEKVRKVISELNFETNDIKLVVTVSIGVAVISERNDDINLVSEADTALYEAKSSGRNRVVYREVRQDGTHEDVDLIKK